MITQRREFDVVFGVICQFCSLLSFQVIHKQIHRTVSVREKVDLISCPHGENILVVVVGDVDGFLCFEIIDPHVVGHTAFVVLPCSELTEHAIKGHFFAIRRIRTPASRGERKLFRQSSFFRHLE